ncbi:MAG: metallophosphoesterase [Bacteroidales bacterium]|nr:metallophosphoesterase [Bacteroidales bacterium]
MKRRHFLSICFGVLLFASCTEEFDYSVYSEHVDDKRKNTTENNIQRLEKQNSKDFSDFSVFLISDTHLYYRELRDARRKINSLKQEADFVIHCGDISNMGLSKEYEFTWDLLDEIELPYLTVIGNHDMVANGRVIYQKMFGKLNYSYVYKNCKFVFFDDNIWENTVRDPDFEWLKREITDSLSQYAHTILIAHIPPWDDQLYNSQKHAFYNIVGNSNVQLCIYGHHHVPFSKQDTLPSGRTVTQLVTGSVRYHTIRRLDVRKDTLIINDIKF